MSKRVGPRGGKGKAARKRDAARDLSARAARKVVGGLLPAVQVAREVSAPTQGTSTRPTEQVSFSYSKLEF